MRKLKVIIIGAGTGGLSLAHGLHGLGLDVRVFGRDRRLTDRVQGYRITINAAGARALQSCLPSKNFERYIAASAKISTAVTFFDHNFRRLLSVELPATDQSAPDAARPISRIALRQILLEGLEDVVVFGKTFAAFETSADGKMIARFEDGSTAEGDVVVGADGAGSHVRRQLLPDAQRIDIGLIAVSGKVPLDVTVRNKTPPAIFNGPTLVLGPRGGFMFAGAVEYPPNHLSVYDQDEYVMWGYSAHRDTLKIEGAADVIAREDARAAVLAQLADWNADLRYLVEHADASSLTSFVVKSSVSIPHWTTSRTTLLGDALHNMTPYRGVGANTALRDAAVLRDALRDVHNGRRDLIGALSAYEEEMIKYGFAAVRASLAQMERLHTRSLTKRFGTKVLFRILDLSPALRKRVLDLGG
jgi:2-polyprenyl-6-methoxyphenol hydroxylase-like FAD-dependent oxidoreductase